MSWTDAIARLSRGQIAAACVLLIVSSAVADHLSGSVLSFALVYLLAISAAAWFISAHFAYALSLLSVVLWLGGDLVAGERWDNALVPLWNGAVRLTGYCLFVAVLSGLRHMQDTLETRVAERSAALAAQSRERERLQQELLAVSEREKRSFGEDLHDSLCQHLAGTAMAGQVVAQKLAARRQPEAESARNVVQLIESAISQSRKLARGLSPVELHSGGLRDALQEFAASTSELFKVRCFVTGDGLEPADDPMISAHVYRIAQEAVGNAVKHARASRIEIEITSDAQVLTLTVRDDGIGLPDPLPSGDGMGLRIMAHRASVIGAQFELKRSEPHGTVVSCVVPLSIDKRQVKHG